MAEEIPIHVSLVNMLMVIVIDLGLDEGWADVFAFMLTTKPTDTRSKSFSMAAYSVNSPGGIRPYPYSTSLSVNPLKCNIFAEIVSDIYKNPNINDKPHSIGSVWASILYEIYWNLIEAKGFSSNWMDSHQMQGNIVMMKIVVAGLKYAPCNPSFWAARNAIIFAERVHYGGIHKCLLWKGFAKRGLGTDSVGSNDGFGIPQGCQ